MPYLIDGHNLIPKIPGLSLRAIDDEIQLVEVLHEFCRIGRRQVEVYFDQAPPGQSGKRRYGQVIAHFVRQGGTADAAIRQRLESLGKSAANWTVVSSDLAVQGAAQARRAQVISAEDFAHLLRRTFEQTNSTQEERPGELSPDEVAEWLAVFEKEPKKKPKRDG